MQPIENEIVDWFLRNYGEIRSELQQQVNSAKIEEAHFTGTGAFVDFSPTDATVPIDNELVSKNGLTALDGLFIESPELEAGAEVFLGVDKGYISYIEIWAYAGVYPTDRHVQSYKLIDMNGL